MSDHRSFTESYRALDDVEDEEREPTNCRVCGRALVQSGAGGRYWLCPDSSDEHDEREALSFATITCRLCGASGPADTVLDHADGCYG